MSDDSRFFYWVLLGTTVLHVAVAVVVPVSGDEAYYWDCSRHLDWAYFDQPPLVIWTMIPARAALGETALAVRTPAIVASLIMALALLGVVRRLGGGPREAAIAYLVLHGTPLVFLGSSYTSTDIAMIAAYTVASWAAMAVADGELRAWWGFGAAIGLGFLAKFPMVLALTSIMAAVVWGEGRRHLRRATPYFAAALAFVVTAPVWIWGAHHDWVNILFQLTARHRPTGITLSHLGEYLGANLALLSPPLAIALVVAWWLAWRRTEPAWRVAVVAAATPFVFFGVLALRSRMSPHWGVPGLVTAAAVLVVLTVVAFPDRVLDLQWTYSRRPNRINTSSAIAMIIGNDELARQVASRVAPGELVASSSYTLTHLLAFLSRGTVDARLADIGHGRHGLASLYWYPPDELVGRNVLFVTTHDGDATDEALATIFSEVAEEAPIEIVHDGRVVRRLRVLRCSDLEQPVPAFTRLR
jgi:4-amino-4-deoxy-L-arabinose transferase-like glycosyltransferase